jgi:uncharacterized protein YuzE
MAVQQIARENWHDFLEHFTRTIQGREAEVEVVSDDFGDQRLAEGVRLLGLSYDARGDVLEVELENVGHRVAHPGTLFVDLAEAGGVIGIEIEGEDGVRNILRLREPLMLPEPAQG